MEEDFSFGKQSPRKKRIKKFVKQMKADKKKRNKKESSHKKNEEVVTKTPNLESPRSPSLQHAYDATNYWDPKEAAREFIELNKEVSKNKKTDMQTVKSFLKNVYKGGDHDVSLKKFIKALLAKGITVVDRRENRMSDLEVVGESKMKLRDVL